MAISFIAGGFDCLHEGHLHLLKEAAKLAPLYIGLNHDAYFKKKGENRPIDKYAKRASNLLATGLVKCVWQIGDSPLELILRLKPDYIVVGNDYDIEKVVGAKECLTWGGEVVIIPRIKGLSTTKIINEQLKPKPFTELAKEHGFAPVPDGVREQTLRKLQNGKR